MIGNVESYISMLYFGEFIGETKMNKDEIKAILNEIDTDDNKWDARWQEGWSARDNRWSWEEFFAYGFLFCIAVCVIIGIFFVGYLGLMTLIDNEISREKLSLQHSGNVIESNITGYVCIPNGIGQSVCTWH